MSEGLSAQQPGSELYAPQDANNNFESAMNPGQEPTAGNQFLQDQNPAQAFNVNDEAAAAESLPGSYPAVHQQEDPSELSPREEGTEVEPNADEMLGSQAGGQDLVQSPFPSNSHTFNQQEQQAEPLQDFQAIRQQTTADNVQQAASEGQQGTSRFPDPLSPVENDAAYFQTTQLPPLVEGEQQQQTVAEMPSTQEAEQDQGQLQAEHDSNKQSQDQSPYQPGGHDQLNSGASQLEALEGTGTKNYY
jgi:hypothetical protein